MVAQMKLSSVLAILVCPSTLMSMRLAILSSVLVFFIRSFRIFTSFLWGSRALVCLQFLLHNIMKQYQRAKIIIRTHMKTKQITQTYQVQFSCLQPCPSSHLGCCLNLTENHLAFVSQAENNNILMWVNPVNTPQFY